MIDGPFELLGHAVDAGAAEHGDMEVLGFRVGGMAYLTDFSRVACGIEAAADGLDDLVLDALRDDPHPMHQTVAQALELIAELRPRRAWFTHIAHDLPHRETNERLAARGLPARATGLRRFELRGPRVSDAARCCTRAAEWAAQFGASEQAGNGRRGIRSGISTGCTSATRRFCAPWSTARELPATSPP